jgi:nitronate monooxygenase
VRSSVLDIRRVAWPVPFTGRALRNTHADLWLGREIDLLQQIELEAPRYATAREPGNFDIAAVYADEAVDLIDSVPPAAIIVERVVSEAARLPGAAVAMARRRTRDG